MARPRNESDAVQEEQHVEVVSTEQAPERKKKRVPFGALRSKLTVLYQIPGYHLHWINDTPGRIHEAQQGDYEFVSPKEVGFDEAETKVKRLVGKNDDGSALYAYLMKIRQDWYDEDQKTYQAYLDDMDNQIRNGRLNEKAGDKRYVPREGISMKT